MVPRIPANAPPTLNNHVQLPQEIMRCGLQVIGRIVGEQELPWEGDGKAKQLLKRAGRFKDAVLGLVHRDPEHRALVQTFMQQYASIMATTTQQDRYDNSNNKPEAGMEVA